MRVKSFVLALLLVTMMIVGGCSSSPSGGTDGGLSGEIVVATWGGKYQELLQEFVDAELKKTAPNVKVVYAPGQDTEYRAKAIAEKDSAAGTYDVMLFGADAMAQMVENDLIVALDYSKIGNYQYVKEDFKNDYYIPHIFSALTLAYNENHVTSVPDSWEALYDPQYKGKIGVMEMMRTQWLFTAVVADGADPETANWMDHFDKILGLKDLDVKFYASNDALGSALQSGEVWLSLGWRARNALLTVDGSEPIGDVVPKEGTISWVYGACIPKNAKNPEAAYAYLNAMLAADAQLGFGVAMGYSPTVNNVTLPQDAQDKIAFTADEEKRIYPFPGEFIYQKDLEVRPEWEQKFIGQ